jgi:uncharacterized OsmC-like protein
MDAQTLKAVQAPLKARYRDDADAACMTLDAESALDADGIACSIKVGGQLAAAGLHPATGGSGAELCSGNMLLEALAACAGVTLRAVATAKGLDIKRGAVKVEGDIDFRGTLGIDKTVPVGFKAIRLRFEIETDASADVVAETVELTERYCVVLQTLRTSPDLAVTIV